MSDTFQLQHVPPPATLSVISIENHVHSIRFTLQANGPWNDPPLLPGPFTVDIPHIWASALFGVVKKAGLP